MLSRRRPENQTRSSSANIWPRRNINVSESELPSFCTQDSDKLSSDSEATSSSWTTSWTHPHTGAVYSLSLSQSRNTSEADLDTCCSLVEETSRRDYEASSRGWNPTSKRKEMRDPDLRYVIVRDSIAGEIRAFTSLMPTLEEGEAVVYCYEIHLKPDLRGTGLAGLLMGFLETVARNIGVMEKVMLTVFTCNTRAVEFYRRCGFETDEASPQPRQLRNGVIKEPDYAIMSKRVDRQRRVVSSTAGQNGVSGRAVQDTLMARPAKVAKTDSSLASLEE